MSPESGDQNREPGASNSGQAAASPAGQGQDNGSGGQGEPAQPGASPPDLMPPEPPPATKWSARTGQSVPNLPPHLREAMETTPVETVRTMLDHDALKGVVSRTFAEKEGKVAELKLDRAAEPLKPFLPIENYRKATPCSSTWEGSDGKERFRFCEQCQCQVYDFTGLELPEAEQLIFKRESRRNAPLFQRKDGKFLTSDCPVGVKRKRTLFLAVVGGSLLVVSLLVMLMMMPPPPKPTITATPAEAVSPQGKAGSQGKGSSTVGTSAPTISTPAQSTNDSASEQRALDALNARLGNFSSSPAQGNQPAQQNPQPDSAQSLPSYSANQNRQDASAGANFNPAGAQQVLAPGNSMVPGNASPVAPRQHEASTGPARDATTSEPNQPSGSSNSSRGASSPYVKYYK